MNAMASVFFSYSHKDEQLRNELETHLALLKRQEKITTWYDRRISAGSEIDLSISEELESAQIILLLVSANFLASNYCYEKEMERALERHKAHSAVVIPVILHPCDWHSAPFGSLRASPTDGKPISMYANMHEAFSIVTKDIRAALEKIPSEPSAVAQNNPVSLVNKYNSNPRSSNLAIKREFNDHERDEFLENSYEYIARFFMGSLDELEKRNAQIQTRLKRIDETSFTVSVYSNGRKVTSCSIWYGSRGMLGSQEICYSSGDNGRGNSINEIISVTDDGYSLKLKPVGMQSFGQNSNKYLSQQGGAEHLWEILIRPLQQ